MKIKRSLQPQGAVHSALSAVTTICRAQTLNLRAMRIDIARSVSN